MVTHSSLPAWDNPKDRGVWWATVHRVAKESDTTEVTQYTVHSTCKYNAYRYLELITFVYR